MHVAHFAQGHAHKQRIRCSLPTFLPLICIANTSVYIIWVYLRRYYIAATGRMTRLVYSLEYYFSHPDICYSLLRHGSRCCHKLEYSGLSICQKCTVELMSFYSCPFLFILLSIITLISSSLVICMQNKYHFSLIII